MNHVIEITDLRFGYNRHAVLDGISLKVPAGSMFGFLGPNDAGKSTTIKVILGLLQVSQGMVKLFGKELQQDRIGILGRTGAMVESPSLYDHLSARRNLEITRRLRNLPAARIAEVLEIVGLIKDADRAVKQFSTGMKQRLSLAVALLAKPELLILDEPINGLDPSGIIEIRNLLIKLNLEENCTIFLSSHILDEVEKMCSHVAVIDNGKILYQGQTVALLKQSGKENYLMIRCSKPEKALEILRDQAVETGDDFIRLRVNSDTETAGIIKRLVQGNVDIYSAEHFHSDLESSFLELLKEGGKV
jgi:ABC-2 type transport system ATP-binding protein